MRKALFFLVAVMSMFLFGSYEEGDIVDNYTFKDFQWTDEGNMAANSRSLHEIIDSGKIALIYFFDISYS